MALPRTSPGRHTSNSVPQTASGGLEFGLCPKRGGLGGRRVDARKPVQDPHFDRIRPSFAIPSFGRWPFWRGVRVQRGWLWPSLQPLFWTPAPWPRPPEGPPGAPGGYESPFWAPRPVPKEAGPAWAWRGSPPSPRISRTSRATHRHGTASRLDKDGRVRPPSPERTSFT